MLQPLRQNQLSHANISFWNVQLQEPFDSFLTELRSRVESCDFENRDLMIYEIKSCLQSKVWGRSH